MKSKSPSQKPAVIALLVAVILITIGAILVAIVDKEAGYSGSEANLIAVPFVYGGYLSLFCAIIIYIVTAIRRAIYYKKNKDQ